MTPRESRQPTAPHGNAADTPRHGPPFAYAGLPQNQSADRSIHVVPKPYFTIGYSEAKKNPVWVCYAIGPAVDLTAYPRPSFVVDAATSARVSTRDYTNSGFSRGHMAPRMAISSRFGRAGNDATFVMSNVCPQYQAFNDGQWGNLEEWIAGRKASGHFVKGWADIYGRVWVTVGPVFDEPRPALPSGVAVPNAFYCIVVDDEGQRPRVLAFMMAHVDRREPTLTRYLKSVDEIERRTGLDFMSELPDELENDIEARPATALWPLPESPN